MGDQAWILAIVGSTVSWAVADLILDVTIGEANEHAPPPSSSAVTTSGQVKSDPGNEDSDDGDEDSLLSRSSSSSSTARKRHRKLPIQPLSPSGVVVTATAANGSQPHMTGDQDTAVAGVVTLFIVYLMCFMRWTSHRKLAREFKPIPGGPATSGVGGLWSPFHDFEWWVAALGGILLFSHYQTLYWAYDHAPSTVINPLLQVSSTWVLLGTAVPAFFFGGTFIQPFDLFCYAIIVFGGLLPSLESDWRAFFRKEFWKQSFVKNAVLSEITLGMYDLLLTWVLKQEGKQKEAGNVMENEFFFLAWCWFVIAFAFAYGLHPRLQEEYQGLRKIAPKTIALAGVGQVVMFVGYYSSQFGYSWFYQASVVHAAESSMAQGFNLILAFIAKRCFNVGRDSAVQGMKYKMISVCVVTVGLGLIAFHDVATGASSHH
ncbi:hypothetical protein BASA81_008346 [Batrachochytrium salamandrivorans]|nr:hypothetical protein BASA81_008346 [Batrachochytrium salamandrivorans]